MGDTLISMQQIPILLRIQDYANYIVDTKEQHPTFKKFFDQYLDKEFAPIDRISLRLEHELRRGRCLLLFDGLDEVANDTLRSRIPADIQTFISSYTTEVNNIKMKAYNRFIITSRIAGYKGGLLSSYSHYTLLEFTDEQVKAFLTTWYPAVERHRRLSATSKKILDKDQEIQARNEGMKKRDGLLETLKHDPGISKLAVNPLMLTILATLQPNSKNIQNRVRLYRIITHALLESRNYDTKYRAVNNVNFTEQVLRRLAFKLHGSDHYMTRQEVEEIVSTSMSEFHEIPPNKIHSSEVEQFIKMIGRTSGLFVESGQGLFSFMLRPFQEYFVAQYLLLELPNEFQKYVLENCRSALWREPLLLAIAEKSGQNKQGKEVASLLLQSAVSDDDIYDPILHRNLLFAINSIVDCGTWSINSEVQKNLANYLFDLYADSYNRGRYTQLQKDIEGIMLQWLYRQSGERRSALLDAWHTALCTNNEETRQKGAVHLLASLAPDLPRCTELVLNTLIPPLLKLARLDHLYQQELSCPSEIHKQLLQMTAQPCSLKIEEYAFVVLQLLDTYGPCGWLHKDWLVWNEKCPKLLELLTQHSLELDYLLTPVAFPVSTTDPNLDKQIEIAHTWKKLAKSNPGTVQTELLNASNTARYPHAYLFKRLLERELSFPSQAWRNLWDNLLREEMSYGYCSTYRTCLYLRLLIHKDDSKQCKAILDELISAASTSCSQQIQALNTVTGLHMRNLRDLKFLLDLRNLPDLRKLRYLRYLRDLRDISDWRYLRYLSELRNARDILDPQHLRELTNLLNPDHRRDAKDLHYLRDVQNLFDANKITSELCNILEHSGNSSISSMILLAIYSILTYDTILEPTRQRLRHSLELFSNQAQEEQTSIEHRQLIKVITRQIDLSLVQQNSVITASPQGTLEEIKAMFQAIKQKSELNKKDVEDILMACNDSRRISEEIWRKLTGVEKVHDGGTVEQFAWRLLSRSWKLDEEAQETVKQALDHDDAIVCAAAALFLQRARLLPDDTKKAAGEKILRILNDYELSHRPLDPPDYSRIWRLDDVLFETLQLIVEHSHARDAVSS